MQKLIAAAAMTSLLATSAFAEDGALPAGRPSGVSRAQNILDNTPLLVVGGIVVLVAVVLAINTSSSTPVTPSTTTST